ncbi:MAG: phage antirepressor protein, partial [Bacilli bacterium]|nr:phage antirepressor protein [Bacilli bacterium]
MNKEKLNVVNNLFEGKQIRSIWDTEKEDYYFSIVDVVRALTDSPNPRHYWVVLKSRLREEESELVTNCDQLKLRSQDGKFYNTDVLDTEGIFRLIESIPSKKAEPFKLWLAKLGRQEIDNVFDPSLGIDKMINYYISKGYTLEWIEARIKAIINRKK